MPVDETTTLVIVCDNPACPGNTLDPADRTGWLFVSHEIYGEPSASHVFCSASCLSVASGDVGVAPQLGFTAAPAEAA